MLKIRDKDTLEQARQLINDKFTDHTPISETYLGKYLENHMFYMGKKYKGKITAVVYCALTTNSESDIFKNMLRELKVNEKALYIHYLASDVKGHGKKLMEEIILDRIYSIVLVCSNELVPYYEELNMIKAPYNLKGINIMYMDS